MTDHHSGVKLFALVSAVAFAFGWCTARIVVGTGLVAGGLFVAHVLYVIIERMQ